VPFLSAEQATLLLSDASPGQLLLRLKDLRSPPRSPGVVLTCVEWRAPRAGEIGHMEVYAGRGPAELHAWLSRLPPPPTPLLLAIAVDLRTGRLQYAPLAALAAPRAEDSPRK
jgi:hypothetical protein